MEPLPPAEEHEGTAPERLRKDLIVAAVADNHPQTTAAAEAGMVCGNAVDASTVDHYTAWNTTSDHQDRPGRVSERTAGDRQVDSYDLDRSEWRGTRNGWVVEKSTAWNGSLGCSRNEVGQMSHEGEGIYAPVVGMERDLGKAGSKRKNLAVVGECREEHSSRPACRWVNAHYMRRRGWRP